LPNTIDNTFSGRKIAIWFFYAITIITLVRSLIHTFSSDGGAQSIATIPLNSYSDDAARTVILIFSFWGLSQLIMGIFYAIVAIRYKSLIPLMYLFIFFEYSFRVILGHLKPISTIGTPPGEIGNYVFIPLSLVLLVVSIYKTDKLEANKG
jgi:hypothetical protein